PTDIDGHQPNTRFDKPARQQNSLAPGRHAASIRGGRFELGHESVALPDGLWLGIKIESVTGFLSGQDIPSALLELVHRLHLATLIYFASQIVHAAEQCATMIQPLQRYARGQCKIRNGKRRGLGWIRNRLERVASRSEI